MRSKLNNQVFFTWLSRVTFQSKQAIEKKNIVSVLWRVFFKIVILMDGIHWQEWKGYFVTFVSES